MTAEALTTRLNRERLAALNKFIPIRDALRNQLRQRQDARTEFFEDTSRLFLPITAATGEVKTATERAIYGDIPESGTRKEVPVSGLLEKIAAETEKTQQGIQELKTLRESEFLAESDPPPEIEITSDPKRSSEQKIEELRGRFNEDALAAIDKTEPNEFPVFVVTNYENRRRLLNPDQYKYIKGRQHWADIFYKIKTKTSRIDTNSVSYIQYISMVNRAFSDYEIQKTKLKLDKIKKTGKGISPIDSYANVVCPCNITSDISRLEVLIGGKRAGNNSPEIVNEAADICRRLFSGKIMDIHTYRELIEELVENHQGYHSD